MPSHRRSGMPPRSGDPAWHRPFPRLPVALAGIAVALAALSIGLPNIAPDLPLLAAEGSPVRLFFGVAEEMNLPTAFSVAVLTAAAVTHAVVGRLAGGRTGAAFAVVAVLLALLALDDFTALHERLDVVADRMGVEGGYTWVVPGLVVAAGVVAAFWRLATRLQAAARRDLLFGILLFLGAAFGLETLNGMLDQPGTDGAPLQIGTHVEEVTENVGVIIVLRAALGVLEVSRNPGGFAVRVAGGLRRGADRTGPPGLAEQTTPIPAVR